MTHTTAANWQDDLLDRELVLTRVVNVPRELLFSLWTDPEHLPKWFGPDGFTIETREINITVGGRWCFDMIAPDGTCYGNRMIFTRIDSPAIIEMEHGNDIDNDPGRFRMRVEFLAQPDGKTIVVLRQLHPSKKHREIVIGIGAVELGYQTLDKMAAYAATK